ncbi:MAG: transporter [Anaerolineales bacterium]|nr:bile acid:sodium symporter family protein [Anaerolineae bacterium]PWB55229.1 MAG: transporter [Anaerolineales bacterium]
MDLYKLLMLIMNLSTLVFVVTSMLAMGFSLAITQIVAPLRNARLVILALIANFVVVPAIAYLITSIYPLADGLKIGLLLVSAAAGAPFLPKLAQIAKGNLAFSVGLMVLLMVFTVGYLPIVLPLLLQGISVNPWSIARPLILLMLIPLSIGLIIKARYAGIAGTLHPFMARVSTTALILVIAAGLLANLKAVLGVVGSIQIIAVLLFLALAFIFGYFLGGKDGGIRSVLGLGTAQRNLSAALVIATANFAGNPDVIVMVLVLGLMDLTVLLITAYTLARRNYEPQPI